VTSTTRATVRSMKDVARQSKSIPKANTAVKGKSEKMKRIISK